MGFEELGFDLKAFGLGLEVFDLGFEELNVTGVSCIHHCHQCTEVDGKQYE